MKAIFHHHEIQQALADYMAKQGVVIADREVDIKFQVSRKPFSISAEVDVEDKNITFPPVAAPAAPSTVSETDSSDEVQEAKPEAPKESPPFTPDNSDPVETKPTLFG